MLGSHGAATATLTAAALTDGVKFLYVQAGEMIKGWRERRRNPNAAGPRLADLKDAVERIKDGVVPVDAPESLRAIGLLRDYLEQLTGASITSTARDRASSRSVTSAWGASGSGATCAAWLRRSTGCRQRSRACRAGQGRRGRRRERPADLESRPKTNPARAPHTQQQRTRACELLFA